MHSIHLDLTLFYISNVNKLKKLINKCRRILMKLKRNMTL